MVLTHGDSISLGQLERTPRAFWQDASEAMRGDIVRAIVEYVTNSDDAYVKKVGKGRILIEVEHRRGTEPWSVRIRDRATGMTLNELKQKIGRQGGRTSGFADGLAVRGNLGLGSKDPAVLGKVTFESIKDDKYAWFAIDDQGERTTAAKPVTATRVIRERLGIPGDGTVVTIEVIHPTSCPRHDNLKYILSNHILLRTILEDTQREVFLLHANKPGAKPERLSYERPKVVDRVHRQNVELPGYSRARVELLIQEADRQFDDEGRKSVTRKAGVLVRGQRAVYESTLFSFEGNTYALAFTGFVRCDDIDKIAREYDDRAEKRLPHSVDNPLPIISRRRDGLMEEHPLYQALKRYVESELGPLVAAREKRVRELHKAVENTRTSRLLSQLAREAARFMQEAAEEEELDVPPVSTGGEPAAALAIIPDAISIPIGSQRTVTVMAAKVGLGEDPEVELGFAPPGIVEGSAAKLKLGPSRRRDDVMTATLRITARSPHGATLLRAKLGMREADCAIEVVEPSQAPEPIAPYGLEFERKHYRLVLNKPKAIRIRAPLGSYSEGAVITVTSDTRRIAILDGGTTILKSRPSDLAMEGKVRVEGRSERERGTLMCVDAIGVRAHADVEVVRREEGGADFEPRLVPEVQGDQRAQWSSDYHVLRIMGEHPALRPYLGNAADEYPGQNSDQFKVLLAELITDAVVRRILLEKYRDDEIDAATLYVQQYKLMGRFLARAHRVVAAAD